VTDIHEQAIVSREQAGDRLDKVAANLFDTFSRAQLSRFIAAGALTVNGHAQKGRFKLKGGESLELKAEREVREAWSQPEDIALDILYEDDDLLVLNKPAGLVVHPGAGNPAGTLVNALLHHRPGLDALPRAGIVHRLDKETSGVMVVAASDAAQLALTRAIGQRQVERRYLGITEGRMVSGQDVDMPIGRDPRVRTRQAVRDDGKPAFTEFRVLERWRLHTLVAARLGSGRTHQIRVHLQSIGFPLVGDRRYGARGRIPPGATMDVIETVRQFRRQALHAHTLAFKHPISESDIAFEAPWPDDMLGLAAVLRDDV